MKNKQAKILRNINWLTAGIMLLFVITIGRYFILQVIQHSEMEQKIMNIAKDNVVRQSPRGKILDRNGRELAISRIAKLLVIRPDKVGGEENIQVLAAELSPIINIPAETIASRIREGGAYYAVKHGLESNEEAAINQLKKDKGYECMWMDDEVKRYYPNDMLAANIIGFIGMEDKGLEGLEYSMDSIVKGDVQEDDVLTDMRGRTIFDSIFSLSQQRYRGDNCKTVTLTIDATMQFIVEQVLDKAMVENQPQNVTAIVMDPKNGEILAMASRPSYNPNKFGDFSMDAIKNRAVSDIYEPGSTFKSIVAGAALEEGVVTPDQSFYDPGRITVSEKHIQNWNGESFGTVTFTDIVKNSINTCFAMIGQILTGEKLNEYARKFGFGEPTGVELPGEASGMLFETDKMLDSDIATMSIGQSIAVTPLQLVTAMSAIANDGVLLKPHIVKNITNADGSMYKENGREEVRRVLSSATDKTLMGLLEQVVATGGGQKAQVKGYRVAGKTGTAQKINKDTAGYMDGRYIASFCGFAPVEDPQLVVLVIIDDPSAGAFYGGQIAAPVAGEIFSQLLRYKHIEPSSDPFADMDKEHGQKAPQPAVKTAPPGKQIMPDLRGMSIREVSQKLGEMGLGMNIQGTGLSSGQSIPANTVVEPGSSVTVYFTP
ncbi:Cell division protein FtsI (Peptidoglycan synthetase) [Anaerovibrio sp. JC8]|uniref:penicillin-binding protein n=1 Tax=Anaerovibrio sp. JC8 TaxID=1240085 RepID=UPI000A0AFB19|nr:penicillin-binding transpeptidase domain-containing protein [Anaerovibrio sp. JC8]ORT99237.1 Cell division protein FtsI (Peptidoglycan synthetase) [Anaerovibrio sp. JC8]